MGFRQGTTEDGEILGEDIDDPAVDGAPAGDDAVTRDLLLLHAEIDAAVLDEHVELLEGAFVQQKLDAFARRELAAPMLRVDALLSTAELGIGTPFRKLFENLVHVACPYFLISVIARRSGGKCRIPACDGCA